MQSTEVTQGQWEAVMGSNPSSFAACGADCPVEDVSWNDIQEFIIKLNQRGEGTYRLPTEAEWEYAARAGTSTLFLFGKCLSTDQANYDGDYPYEGCPSGEDRHTTVPVASFATSAWGLYDMYGSGVRTGIAVAIIRTVRSIIPRGRLKARSGFYAAAAGTATRGTAALRTGSSTGRAVPAATLASGLSIPPDQRRKPALYRVQNNSSYFFVIVILRPVGYTFFRNPML